MAKVLPIAIVMTGLGLWGGAALPAWWTSLRQSPKLEAKFVHVSESAVFGRIRRTGSLLVAPGGRLRVAYDEGLLLISEGRELIQYDPDTRTAQVIPLAEALREFPLLGLLVSPERVDLVYRLTPLASGGLKLEAKTPQAIRSIELDGKGGQLQRIRWQDPSGAAQELELEGARIPSSPLPSEKFKFQAPAGTRWIRH